jgi:hypothetical protein
MRRAELCVVLAGLIKAELAVDGEAHFGGVSVLLTIILPPADRTQLQGPGRIEGFISTAGTPEAHFNCRTHAEMDDTQTRRITTKRPRAAILTVPLFVFESACME